MSFYQPVNWTTGPSYEARKLDSLGTVHKMAWNVAPDQLMYIPEHWLVYDEPEASLHFLLGLLYVAFFIASVVGNGLVIWIFSSAKSLRTASNMFVVNLALCDLIMMFEAPIFVYNSFYRGATFTYLSCQIYAFVGALSGIGGGMTNAFIAYDRYTAITHPFDGKLTRPKALLMIVGIWLYTIPWAVLPFMEVWGRFVPEGFLTACTFDYLTDTFDNHLFVAMIFFCSYVVPMMMIIYFYGHIVKTVFTHEKTLRDQAKKMNVESLRANQSQASQSAELRIAKAAITICFLFVAAWTPYAVLALTGAFGDQSLLTPGVTMIPAVACKTVGCIDPYVYAISHPRYRVELQKRLPWLAIKETSLGSGGDDNQSTTTEKSQSTPAI